MEIVVRDDGNHAHVLPVKQADDLGSVCALVTRIEANRCGTDARHHPRQDADVMPEMAWVIGMLHGQPFKVIGASQRLLAENFFDLLNNLLIN